MPTEKKPDGTWSKRRLRGYYCGWCGQRLDRLVDADNCSAIYRDKDFKCHWRAVLGKTGDLK